jgi:hypothetical protein
MVLVRIVVPDTEGFSLVFGFALPLYWVSIGARFVGRHPRVCFGREAKKDREKWRDEDAAAADVGRSHGIPWWILLRSEFLTMTSLY